MTTNGIKTEALQDLTGKTDKYSCREEVGLMKELTRQAVVTLWAELQPVRSNKICQTDAVCVW